MPKRTAEQEEKHKARLEVSKKRNEAMAELDKKRDAEDTYVRPPRKTRARPKKEKAPSPPVADTSADAVAWIALLDSTACNNDTMPLPIDTPYPWRSYLFSFDPFLHNAFSHYGDSSSRILDRVSRPRGIDCDHTHDASCVPRWCGLFLLRWDPLLYI